jgi:hypothetical protein
MIVSKEASNIGIASRLTQKASQSIAQRNWVSHSQLKFAFVDFVDRCQVLDHPGRPRGSVGVALRRSRGSTADEVDSCVMPRRYRISVDDARNCCLSLDEEETDSRWR